MKKEKPSTNFKGFIKVQFIAAKPNIEKALSDGYSIKYIWNDLKEKKVFDGAYTTFILHYKNLIKAKEITPKKGFSESSTPLTEGAESTAEKLENAIDEGETREGPKVGNKRTKKVAVRVVELKDEELY